MDDGYKEFQRIMADLQRTIQLQELKKGNGDPYQLLKDMFGI